MRGAIQCKENEDLNKNVHLFIYYNFLCNNQFRFIEIDKEMAKSNEITD